MNENTKFILEQVSGLHDIPQAGIYNIRENGKLLARNIDEEVNIISKKDKDGIDIVVKPNTKNKSIHIPVIVSMGGLNDLVYNDFYIGDNADILIVAGCGIHNTTDKQSSHNGIHSFHIGKNCKVKYVEKHFAFGNAKTSKILNPTTEIVVGEGSVFEMETLQLGGVSFADRKTYAKVKKDAKLLIRENILTSSKEEAITHFEVELEKEGSRVEVVSRAVAKDKSKQEFNSIVIGKAECFGHVECDGILADNAEIISTPKIIAKSPEANLVHEAAIGKISEEQQNKLMSLGLTKEEAEKVIIQGFLK
ncbi:MAG: SufD family Fe-S cluster assembly protein [Clostridia bacterium]|nr:SufD family Fe-S cluster assembly protein [Clostridia bacterium]